MNPAIISDITNQKLGPLIHSWSLPAGTEWSCPGESGICRARCYAKRGHFQQRNVREAYLRNWDFAHTEGFVDWMIAALKVQFVRVMRIHVSGDYYDVDYVRKWVRVVKAARRVYFFAYTRSWRREDQLPELIQLSRLPNFQLFWSIDRETGPAPLVRGIKRAYMAIDDIDARHAPDDCDLVFRDKPITVLKKANGVLVCPPENGTHPQVKITCSTCGLCWNKQKLHLPKWETTILPYFADTGIEINVV